MEISEFRGTDIINIRVYYMEDPLGKNWKPSPKGITMSCIHIPELKKAVNKAYEEWEKKFKNPN